MSEYNQGYAFLEIDAGRDGNTPVHGGGVAGDQATCAHNVVLTRSIEEAMGRLTDHSYLHQEGENLVTEFNQHKVPEY
jgi:hypothetical protein